MKFETNLPGAESSSAPSPRSPKLARLLPLLFSALLLTGCAHRYDMTLTNGIRVTNVTKPVLDRNRGVFVYKDVAGQTHTMTAGRVVDISPHSDKNAPAGTINPK